MFVYTNFRLLSPTRVPTAVRVSGHGPLSTDLELGNGIIKARLPFSVHTINL